MKTPCAIFRGGCRVHRRPRCCVRTRRSLLLLLIASLLFAVPVYAEGGKESHGSKPAAKEGGHGEEGGEKKPLYRKKRKPRIEKPMESHAIGENGASAEQFAADEAAAAKIDAVVVIDASRSMLRTDPQRLRDQGAKLLLRFLGDGDRVAIVQFSDTATVVVPFTGVNPTELPRLDTAISGIVAEGNFTDIRSGIETATALLTSEARPEAKKVIVLLSDGKMDPSPDKGTGAELAERVRAVDLPKLKEAGTSLYTLSLSPESDKALLEGFAQDAGGQHWYAPDPSSIHRKFSELFLSIKKPQVASLEGGGFDIDSSVQEATFYVTREAGVTDVVLINPKGEEISPAKLPPSVKWFSGELFDVITIQKPITGRWALKGMDNPEGFATLLSDLKLQVRWPEPNLKLGDSLVMHARLTNEGQTVSKPGLEEIIYLSYKIVSASDGAVVANGPMSDKGDHGDEKPKDDIYSATLKFDQEGEFMALVAATAPTFTRQQRIPFSVSRGLVALKKTEADEFAGTKPGLQVELSSQVENLRQVKVQLVAKKEGEAKAVGMSLLIPKDGNIIDVPLDRLKPGKYALHVRLSAVDTKKKAVNASSETVQFQVGPPAAAHAGGHDEHPVEDIGDAHAGEEHGTEVVTEEPIDEHGEEGAHEEAPPDAESYLVWGLISVVLSLGAVGGLFFFGMKKVANKGGTIAARDAYEISEELQARIESIRTTASPERRAVGERDREVFSMVSDVFG